MCTTLGEGGKAAESNERDLLEETAGLGLRHQALVYVSLSLNTHSSGVLNGERKDLESPPQGHLLTASTLCLPCFYLPGQPESENVIIYADCFSLFYLRLPGELLRVQVLIS